MKHVSICFALTLALLGSGVHANSSDENKYICIDPTTYDGAKTNNDGDGNVYSCDEWVDAFQSSGQGLNGITLNNAFSAASQTTAVQNAIKQLGTTIGCCSDGRSAAFKNHSYFCSDPNDWLPFHTYSGSETDGGTISCTEFIENNNDALEAEDFTTSWSCDGKSSAIQMRVQDLGAALMGCCGSTKKSACSNTRSHVCQDPTTFLPAHTFQSDDGLFDGTCYTAVASTNTDATSDCYGSDFSQTWSCANKPAHCQLRQLEIARKGCCGTAGETVSACHGHYSSGAASYKHAGFLALAMAFMALIYP